MKKSVYFFIVLIVIVFFSGCVSESINSRAEFNSVMSIVAMLDRGEDTRVDSCRATAVCTEDEDGIQGKCSYDIRIGFVPNTLETEYKRVLMEYEKNFFKITKKIRVSPITSWSFNKKISDKKEEVNQESLKAEAEEKIYLVRKNNKESYHLKYLEPSYKIILGEDGVSIRYYFYAPIGTEKSVCDLINSLL